MSKIFKLHDDCVMSMNDEGVVVIETGVIGHKLEIDSEDFYMAFKDTTWELPKGKDLVRLIENAAESDKQILCNIFQMLEAQTGVYKPLCEDLEKYESLNRDLVNALREARSVMVMMKNEMTEETPMKKFVLKESFRVIDIIDAQIDAQN